MKTLKLEKHQIEHYERLKSILTKNYSVIDLSLMGSGKTYTSCYLAKENKMKLFVVCPTTLINVWEYMKETYKIDIIEIISYDSLRSVFGSQPKHKYLIREDRISEEGIKTSKFIYTEYFLELVKNNKVLLVFDEIQAIKNKSDKYKACRELVQAIMLSSISRILLLSGTPIDKREQVENLMRMLGIIVKKQMFIQNKTTKQYILRGVQDVIDYSYNIDKEKTSKYLKMYKITEKNYLDFIYDVFINIILPSISSKMPPLNLDYDLYIFNHYYNITKDEKNILEPLLNKFNKKIFYGIKNKDEDKIDYNQSLFYFILKMKNLIEYHKSDIFIREAIKVLENKPNYKVVIFLTLNKSIDKVFDGLIKYNPYIIRGETNLNDRAKIIKKFNEPNHDMRVLIGNLGILNVGVSLDDKDGRFPRYVFCIPTYNIMDIMQMTFRFLRYGTKSNSVVNFVYAKDVPEELSIIKALSRKSVVLKESSLVEDDVELRNVKYPDEYKIIVDN